MFEASGTEPYGTRLGPALQEDHGVHVVPGVSEAAGPRTPRARGSPAWPAVTHAHPVLPRFTKNAKKPNLWVKAGFKVLA